MSSPILRRIILFIIRKCQAVGRASAFLFPVLARPFQIIASILFRTIVLPIYQVIRRLKRATTRRTYSPLEIIGSQGTLYILISIAVVAALTMNLAEPMRAEAETMGQKTILFALTQDEDFSISGDTTVIVPSDRRIARYYERDNRHLLWQALAPLPPTEEMSVVQTAFGGSTIVTPGIPGGDMPARADTMRREPIVYRVQPGDTLGAIAARFNVSVETLLWENNLRVTSLLRLGQELTILPFSGVRHRVTRGQTLASLARLYGVTTEEIVDANALGRNTTLRIGQDVVIPGGRHVSATIVARPTPSRITNPPLPPSRQPVVARTTGQFLWPTTGKRLNQYFTWRHAGIDIDGDYTSPIYASDDGVVVVSGWGSGYGIHIDIDHANGYKTRYGHHSKNFVRVGDKVKRGQLIAMMGSTGRSTGPHLHFEIILNGRRLNPLNYVR